MRSFIHPSKLSFDLWPTVLTLAVAFSGSTLLSGCIIESGSSPPPPSHDGDNPPPNTLDPNPKTVEIEPDKAFDVKSGDGVGIFVEYSTGGHWHVWTSCDTNVSKATCNFTAFITPEADAKITNISGDALEAGDTATLDSSANGTSTLHLDVHTSTEFDGVTFDTTAGTSIQLEAYLDSDPDPRIVYWISYDAVSQTDLIHNGAPTDPIIFQPTGQ